MRLPKVVVREKKKKVKTLFIENKTVQEISQATGITDKTIRKWLKPYKELLFETEIAQQQIIRRINHAIEKKAPAHEIRDLAETLKTLKSSKLPSF